jgi:hypothetical protein
MYLCPYSTCADAVRAFGLTAEDLPRAVLHDTVNDKKYVQPLPQPQTHSLSIENIKDFVKNTLSWHFDHEGTRTTNSKAQGKAQGKGKGRLGSRTGMETQTDEL